VPLPSPELDLGNVVRLKTPFDGYSHGIIVQHVSRNAWGVPKVGLALYNERGVFNIEEHDFPIPALADFVVSELVILTVTARIRRLPRQCALRVSRRDRQVRGRTHYILSRNRPNLARHEGL
jgi:hypothetical protein